MRSSPSAVLRLRPRQLHKATLIFYVEQSTGEAVTDRRDKGKRSTVTASTFASFSPTNRLRLVKLLKRLGRNLSTGEGVILGVVLRVCAPGVL